jgi:hypothetical protein
MSYLQCKIKTFFIFYFLFFFIWVSSSKGCLPLLLVIVLYSRKVTEVGFSMVLVVLAGVSQEAPYQLLLPCVSSLEAI